MSLFQVRFKFNCRPVMRDSFVKFPLPGKDKTQVVLSQPTGRVLFDSVNPNPILIFIDAGLPPGPQPQQNQRRKTEGRSG